MLRKNGRLEKWVPIGAWIFVRILIVAGALTVGIPLARGAGDLLGTLLGLVGR